MEYFDKVKLSGMGKLVTKKVLRLALEVATGNIELTRGVDCSSPDECIGYVLEMLAK